MNKHSRSGHPRPAAGSLSHEAGGVAAIAPRGARRSARSAEVRSRLLTAAAALVAERQSAAITARDIARAAGVSDGVLYNHFADKHELILAALMGRFEALVADFQAEADAALATTGSRRPSGASAAALLASRVGSLADASFRLQAAALPMLANVLSEPALFQRFMHAIHRPPFGGHLFMGPVEDLVLAERAAGRAGDVEPSAVADLLAGSILLLALVDLLGGRPRATSEARLRAVVRTLVAGLAPRPTHS